MTNMKSSLLRKYFFCYVIMAISMFAILNSYGINRIQKGLMEGKQDILYEEAEIISAEYVSNYFMQKLSLNNLATQLKTIDTFLNTQIWIVQKDGNVILDTRNHGIASKNFNITDYDKTFLKHTFSESKSFGSYLQEEMLSIVYPVTTNYETKGYIVMHTSLQDIKNDCIYYTDMINISFLIFMLVMLVVFAYIYYITVRPVHQLIEAAHQYCDGNMDYELKLKSNDEYCDLAGSMKYMADRLNNLNDYQKKFIANISHDFRSPLTSIKGYVEAIRDGTIPLEMQDKYLGIILFETERLTKLTSGLLELSRYENKGVFLEITSFDINKVIKQTAESFEGICLEKDININLIFSSKELFVDADMGKIQQVLYNLIDNGIKFSSPSSTIKVSTETQSGKVFVSVKDYGCGIPKMSQQKVWNRFYKIDTSRGKDKKGTGLGLSITKEIINAHNENINLISTEGVGTEFTFTLAKSKG